MKKHTIVILDDGRTYSADATVAKVSEEIMERVHNDEDQLLPEYAKAGVDAVTAAECIQDISDFLSTPMTPEYFQNAVMQLLKEHKDDIYPPGVTPAWMGDQSG